MTFHANHPATPRADHRFFARLHLEAVHEAWSRSGINWRINERAARIDWIKQCDLGDGTMYVAQSGRDCDCSTYQHGRYRILASLEAYQAENDRIAEWADGPFHLAILLPDEDVETYSRDLALEAYEDGHPHVIYG